MLNREQYELAVNREKKNFPDQAVMYLRRSLLLNPMNMEARELLMDYYNTAGLQPVLYRRDEGDPQDESGPRMAGKALARRS